MCGVLTRAMMIPFVNKIHKAPFEGLCFTGRVAQTDTSNKTLKWTLHCTHLTDLSQVLCDNLLVIEWLCSAHLRVLSAVL